MSVPNNEFSRGVFVSNGTLGRPQGCRPFPREDTSVNILILIGSGSNSGPLA